MLDTVFIFIERLWIQVIGKKPLLFKGNLVDGTEITDDACLFRIGLKNQIRRSASFLDKIVLTKLQYLPIFLVEGNLFLDGLLFQRGKIIQVQLISEYSKAGNIEFRFEAGLPEKLVAGFGCDMVGHHRKRIIHHG